MRARGSRSNARGDRRLQLLLLPRLFAQGRVWRLVTPIQASFVALRGSVKCPSDRRRFWLELPVSTVARRPKAPSTDFLTNRTIRSCVHMLMTKTHCREAIVREAIVREAIVREEKGRADGGTGTHHGLRRN